MIAQPFGGFAGCHGRVAQTVAQTSGCRFAFLQPIKIRRLKPVLLKATKRASAPRMSRGAVCALATGRAAFAFGNSSQGRRSLSGFPTNGPQGFWPMELNLSSDSKRSPFPSFRLHDLRLLSAGRGDLLITVVHAVRECPTGERRSQDVRGEEIPPVGRHHDNLQFV